MAQSFVGQSLYTLADSSCFNYCPVCTQTVDDITAATTLFSSKKFSIISSVNGFLYHVVIAPVQVVARFIAAVAIIIFVAPLGTAYHLLAAAFDVNAAVAFYILKGGDDATTIEFKEHCFSHLHAGIYDALATLIGILSLSTFGIFFNGIAWHFAFDPINAQAQCQESALAYKTVTQLKLKHSYGLVIDLEKANITGLNQLSDENQKRFNSLRNLDRLNNLLEKTSEFVDGLLERGQRLKSDNLEENLALMTSIMVRACYGKLRFIQYKGGDNDLRDKILEWENLSNDTTIPEEHRMFAASLRVVLVCAAVDHINIPRESFSNLFEKSIPNFEAVWIKEENLFYHLDPLLKSVSQVVSNQTPWLFYAAVSAGVLAA